MKTEKKYPEKDVVQGLNHYMQWLDERSSCYASLARAREVVVGLMPETKGVDEELDKSEHGPPERLIRKLHWFAAIYSKNSQKRHDLIMAARVVRGF